MSERKECQGCPQENEPACCSSRPTGVLSTAFNYFVKPKSHDARSDEFGATVHTTTTIKSHDARSDELAETDEIQRKCGQGTLVIVGMTGNC